MCIRLAATFNGLTQFVYIKTRHKSHKNNYKIFQKNERNENWRRVTKKGGE